MRIIPLALLFSSLALAAPNDGGPVFQSQLLNTSGTTVVDPLSRDWTLNSSTDSVATITNDLVVSGSLTSLASVVTLSTNSIGSVIVDIGGTFVGTITVMGQSTYNIRTFYIQSNATSLIQPSTTTAGNFRVVGAQGFSSIMVQFSSYTSGTANVAVRATTSANPFTQDYQLNAFNLLTNSWLSDGSGNLIGSNNSSLNVNTKTPITANAPASVSVGTSSTSLLAANTSRKGLVVVNNSVGVVSIGIGFTAVAGSGITLYPGGVWNMNENSFTTGAINAISTLTASPVSAQEFQ